MSSTAWTLQPDDRARLIKAAFEAKELAYARYSNFRVGAALLTTTGEIIKVAMLRMLHMGEPSVQKGLHSSKPSEGIKSFLALAVVTDVKTPISPCGICRQVIREFCGMTMPILLIPADYYEKQKVSAASADEAVKEWTIETLLPDSFGPEQLELPRS